MRPMSEILADALSRFGPNGENWIKWTLFHKGPDQLPVGPSDFNRSAKEADSFCAYGAIFKSMHEHGELEGNPFNEKTLDTPLTGRVERLLGDSFYRVGAINDRARDFSTVRKMFCRGIKKALAEESMETTDAKTVE